jgi:hypothetical protein
MKDKKTESQLEDEMRPEYDFGKMTLVGRGIYAERYRAGTKIFLLETDNGEVSSYNESVNRENVIE